MVQSDGRRRLSWALRGGLAEPQAYFSKPIGTKRTIRPHPPLSAIGVTADIGALCELKQPDGSSLDTSIALR